MADKDPVGTKVTGEVVNIMSYGAFVKLEEGLEGLVHISEMSWTRRINHPSEMLSLGDEIEVVVLEIDKAKQEISLGMKQVEANPWMKVAEKYPPNTIIEGKVRNLTNYGAFIEIEEGVDGLLHVSDMSWTKKISHPSEVHKKGDTYYLSYACFFPEKICYATSDSIHGPWRYQGILNEIAGNTETNHQSIIEFQGQDYFIYHTGAVPPRDGRPSGGRFRRSVSIDRLFYTDDGTLKRVIMTSEGVGSE